MTKPDGKMFLLIRYRSTDNMRENSKYILIEYKKRLLLITNHTLNGDSAEEANFSETGNR